MNFNGISAKILSNLPVELFQHAGTFLLCVSGGRDSMLLLAFFAELQAAGVLAAEPVVFYYQHKLRAAAEDDCEFVRRAVERSGWALYIKEGNVERMARRTGRSIEEAARTLRYRALRRLAERFPGAVAVTGHHADDYAESLLLHLTRGGGESALRTMPLFTRLDGVDVFRPLLAIDRATVDEICAEHKIEYREDETNVDPRFRRNLLRARVMPELRELGLDPVKLWRNLHGETSFEVPLPAAEPSPGHIELDRALLAGSTARERKTLLDLCLRRLQLPPAERAFLTEVERQLRRSGEADGRFHLRIETPDLLLWCDRRGPVWLFHATRSPALRPCRQTARVAERALNSSPAERTIDLEYNGRRRALVLGAGETLDHFRPGDRVRLAAAPGPGGRKKLKKVYQELGLPPPVRRHLPLVRDESGAVRRVLLSFWRGDDRAFAGESDG